MNKSKGFYCPQNTTPIFFLNLIEGLVLTQKKLLFLQVEIGAPPTFARKTRGINPILFFCCDLHVRVI